MQAPNISDQPIYNLKNYMKDQLDITIIKQGEDAPLPIMIKELHEMMGTLQAYVRRSYYNIIEKKYNWYTDHGEKHVNAILNMIAEMLFPQKIQMHPFDLFLLFMSTIYHDTGMTRSRMNHDKNLEEILEETSSYIKNPSLKRCINSIAAAHTGDDKLSGLSVSAPLCFKDISESVNIRALAALLRFADEVSETESRIVPELIDSGDVPENSLIFWEFANSVKYSKAIPKELKIKLVIDIKKDILYKLYKVPIKDGTGFDEITFFDYVLQRLEKIDLERRTCCPEFRQYIIIDAVEVKINIVNKKGYYISDLAPIIIELNESYCNKENLTDAFYRHNPDMVRDKFELSLEECEE